jgi:hypothetical protein
VIGGEDVQRAEDCRSVADKADHPRNAAGQDDRRRPEGQRTTVIAAKKTAISATSTLGG